MKQTKIAKQAERDALGALWAIFRRNEPDRTRAEVRSLQRQVRHLEGLLLQAEDESALLRQEVTKLPDATVVADGVVSPARVWLVVNERTGTIYGVYAEADGAHRAVGLYGGGLAVVTYQRAKKGRPERR